MKITVETRVKAPVEKVWQAYINPEDVKQWNTASPDWHTPTAAADFREGGAFSFRMEAKDGSMGFDFSGVYTRIVPLQLIEYTFGDREAKVEFTQTADGVEVRLDFDPDQQYPVEHQKNGWQAILDNFARYVEAKS
ncbi:SRPBCC family protein [Buttiauxella agrestis]|uniref:Putative glutathione S-transferase-related transmembrane protein n=1 Tax=Buttiauxella agrestis ATCC 33320 TaxID=1006004 RepID=A0A085GDQ1_9ENTR|nr:SRPBCC family protein [Buttiauxella agrestis]KFC81846.1 putative glutathione S-transferase-related transmembrane protein [Buttiauxella agrestis ATCC 33320]